ncbi:hypothetical protein CFP56_038210 [Quercus suber]|uniref:Uncharacterized protein n=1 Tax=Quercus suber TaxID=58331 RepID=A0AAW0J3X1_QUESU
MKLPHPQKRSVRLLFSILLLIVFDATVSFHAMLRSADKKTHVLNFNSTLLKYAFVDISEPRAKQEIEQLLEGNFVGQGWY